MNVNAMDGDRNSCVEELLTSLKKDAKRQMTNDNPNVFWQLDIFDHHLNIAIKKMLYEIDSN